MFVTSSQCAHLQAAPHEINKEESKQQNITLKSSVYGVPCVTSTAHEMQHIECIHMKRC